MSSAHRRLLCCILSPLPVSTRSSSSLLFFSFPRRLSFSSPCLPALLLHPHLSLRASYSGGRPLSSSTVAPRSPLAMPSGQRRKTAAAREKQWREKSRQSQSPSSAATDGGAQAVEAVATSLDQLNVSPTNGQRVVGGTTSPPSPSSPLQFGGNRKSGNAASAQRSRSVWTPKSYGTAAVEPDNSSASAVASPSKEERELSKLFKGPVGTDFTVDNYTFSRAQIRATFYPKFENEKSDQEPFWCMGAKDFSIKVHVQ
ncbi:hypothetical protein Taro_019801 [Colocasia esculenta]|uniref:Uncharacterized protein n=1 Tax=Colocasia esculenta TaxID=4460 RepID=A0A843V6K7_COLES|nr:hypothetical protein [Colocasia esculenta]